MLWYVQVYHVPFLYKTLIQSIWSANLDLKDLSWSLFEWLVDQKIFVEFDIAKLSQAQTEASVLAEICFNFNFTHLHPPPTLLESTETWNTAAKSYTEINGRRP